MPGNEKIPLISSDDNTKKTPEKTWEQWRWEVGKTIVGSVGGILLGVLVNSRFDSKKDLDRMNSENWRRMSLLAPDTVMCAAAIKDLFDLVANFKDLYKQYRLLSLDVGESGGTEIKKKLTKIKYDLIVTGLNIMATTSVVFGTGMVTAVWLGCVINPDSFPKANGINFPIILSLFFLASALSFVSGGVKLSRTLLTKLTSTLTKLLAIKDSLFQVGDLVLAVSLLATVITAFGPTYSDSTALPNFGAFIAFACLVYVKTGLPIISKGIDLMAWLGVQLGKIGLQVGEKVGKSLLEKCHLDGSENMEQLVAGFENLKPEEAGKMLEQIQVKINERFEKSLETVENKVKPKAEVETSVLSNVGSTIYGLGSNAYNFFTGNNKSATQPTAKHYGQDADQKDESASWLGKVIGLPANF